MSEKINWEKIKKELSQIKDLSSLKQELNKLSKEIKSIDVNDYLSPNAVNRLKTLETRYNDLLKTIHKIQKQIDTEFDKAMGQVKKARTDFEKSIDSLLNVAKAQGQKLTKKSKAVKKKSSTTSKKKTTGKKASTKAPSAKKKATIKKATIKKATVKKTTAKKKTSKKASTKK